MSDQTALWVSKFVLLSEQNRHEQNAGTTGMQRDDYSVTDILHNQCTVQLRELNFWNLGLYNLDVGHLILRYLVREHCTGRSCFKQFLSVQFCFNAA